MNFLLDYALTAPDTVCLRISNATDGRVWAKWEDVDEESFIVSVCSIYLPLEFVKDEIETIVEPFLFRD